MRDFYAPSAPVPLDQADGLRRMFSGQHGGGLRLLPVAANPHVPFAGVVLDRLAATVARHGQRVLVVDAGAGAPAPHELSRVDLAAGIERVAPGVGYMAAAGLPLSFVDTRGSAAGFIHALQEAAPWADVIVLHAEPSELARVLVRRDCRPLLLGADHPESIKHAYAACKLLVQRCTLMTFDLLLAAPPFSPRLDAIAASLARCADNFLGAYLHEWAVIDPAGSDADVSGAAAHALQALVQAQLALGAPFNPLAAAPAPASAAYDRPSR
jgi:flagellar biosynthesis protein FlhG